MSVYFALYLPDTLGLFSALLIIHVTTRNSVNIILSNTFTGMSTIQSYMLHTY